MNTKFFLLLLISLLISITTSPAAGTKKNKSTEIEMTDSKTRHDDIDITTPPEHSNDTGHTGKVHKPNSDDDGKHHHFHYNRITGRKSRRILLFITKLILTIVHICCFIYCFLHPFH